MKLVYDNIIYSLQKVGGISAYWFELSKRLKDFNTEFFGYENNNIFFKELNTQQKQETKISYQLNRYLNFQKKLPKGSIFHSSYYRIANQKDVLNITTVHDFIYEYHIKGFTSLVHSWQKSRAINKADGIICISENTKNDLLKFFPYMNEEKIKVIYNGVSESYMPLQNPKKDLINSFNELGKKKYILYTGNRSDYKNFNVAVNAVNKLEKYCLVVVGGSKLSKVEKKKIHSDFFHYQNLSNQNLNILYNNAFCLLYPSSYEGFGIPIVEAMKAGCPVVSTNYSSIPEVAGEAALLVDNIQEEIFIKEILKLGNDLFRKKIILKGFEQSKKFSWDKCFAETFKFYQKVEGDHKRDCKINCVNPESV